MRCAGMAPRHAPELSIVWRRGKAEETGLPSDSYDLVSMASSFHWTDFDKACAEFQRMLRPGGRFLALWNPRMVELNPLLVEIEQEITRLNPEVKRVSSGRSGLTEKTDRSVVGQVRLRRRGLSGSAARGHANGRTIYGRLAFGQRFAGAAWAGSVQQVYGFRGAQDRRSRRNRDYFSDPRVGSAAHVTI